MSYLRRKEANKNDALFIKIELLQNRLSSIEEKRAIAWFKQPSIVVSILALFVSFSAFIFNAIQQNKSTQQQLTLRLHDKVAEYGIIQADYQIAVNQEKDSSTLSWLSSKFSLQGQVIAYELMSIANELGPDISTKDSFNVGDVLYRAQQIDDAYRFFQNALSNSENENDSALALQAMGQVRFKPGKLFDVQEGRILFKLAIETIALQNDSQSGLNEATYTHRWAENEKMLNNIEKAIPLYKDALNLYKTKASIFLEAKSHANEIRKIIDELEQKKVTKEE